MHYFAYGSNMSLSRLRERVPSAKVLGCFTLREHDLRFHKVSKDGSSKCDAYFTPGIDNVVYGVLYEIDTAEKVILDKVEGLGNGYDEKEVNVINANGESIAAVTYIATKTNEEFKPYSWYVNHVLIGAKEASLPSAYINSKILTVESVEDGDKERDAKQRAIHS